MKEVNQMRIDREKLAVALVRLGLNGNQLAEKAGLSRGTVTAVRNGKSCSLETAQKLAAVLGGDIIEEVN
jgi:putative transcriptional regulator